MGARLEGGAGPIRIRGRSRELNRTGQRFAWGGHSSLGVTVEGAGQEVGRRFGEEVRPDPS